MATGPACTRTRTDRSILLKQARGPAPARAMLNDKCGAVVEQEARRGSSAYGQQWAAPGSHADVVGERACRLVAGFFGREGSVSRAWPLLFPSRHSMDVRWAEHSGTSRARSSESRGARHAGESQ